MLPQLPALLRADLPEGRGQGAGPALRRGLQRLAGRGVVRGQRRPPDPVVPGPALGRRARGRRGPPQRGARRARGRVLRAATVARAAQHPLRLLGPLLRRLRGDRHRGGDAHRLGHEDDQLVGRRARTRCRRSNMFANSALVVDRLPVLRRAGALPRAEAALRRGADRVDPLRARTGRRRLGRPPRVEPEPAQRQRAALAVLLPAGRRAASSRTASASRTSTASAATTSRSRPTTRTRTAPGPTHTRSPRSCSVTSTRRRCTRSCVGTPSGFLGLEGLGDGTALRSA